MRLWSKLGGAALALTLVAGCESNKEKSAPMSDKSSTVKSNDDKAAKESAAVAKATYHEVKHDGRIYVTATDESAAAAAKGKHPQLAVTKIGYGPNGETVVFEASEGGGVEKKLIDLFKAKHNIK